MINTNVIPRTRKSALLVSLILLIFAFGCGPVPTEFTVIVITPTGSPTPTIPPQPPFICRAGL